MQAKQLHTTTTNQKKQQQQQQPTKKNRKQCYKKHINSTSKYT